MGESSSPLDAFMVVKGSLEKGGSIIGEAMDKKWGGSKKGGFQIFSFSWGADHGATEPTEEEATGEDASRTAKKKKKSKPRPVVGEYGLGIKEFTVSKIYDTASPILFLACCEYPPLDSAKVILRKSGRTQPIDFLIFTFTDVRVESITWDFKDEFLSETVAFKFDTCMMTYLPQKETGELKVSKGTRAKKVGWDLGKKTRQVTGGEDDEEENIDMSKLFGE